MIVQMLIKTERLILRPFCPADAPRVKKLAGDKEIARTTILIPHPYKESDAEEWINTHESMLQKGKALNYAIVLAEVDELIGAIGLTLSQADSRAEMGYWIGVPYWGNGYGTEAAKALLKYGFEELKLNRIFAHHMANNPASGKIMKKIGMSYEGCCRQHVKKWDKYFDIKIYGIVKSDYKNIK